MRFVANESDKPKIYIRKIGKTVKCDNKNEMNLFLFTLSLNDVKFPWVGGLHDITAVLPLRTATDKFDGGSGAAIKNYNYFIEINF